MNRLIGVNLLGLRIGLASCVCWFTPVCWAQDGAIPIPVTDSYIRDLDKVQSDLDAGRMAEARKSLDAINKSGPAFEFEYLSTRAAQSPDEGKAAPDLIRKVARPNVDTRYGVLNPLNRQMVFICRDGSLRIHKLASPDKEFKTERHPTGATIWSGVFSYDGKSFLTGHENGEVLVWNADLEDSTYHSCRSRMARPRTRCGPRRLGICCRIQDGAGIVDVIRRATQEGRQSGGSLQFR